MPENSETGEEDQQDQILECPDCGSARIRETPEGELVCQSCGAVLEEERVQEDASPRAFTAEERERKERTGKPVTYTEPSRGIRTEIGRGKGSMSQVSPQKRGQYHRMRKWQRRLDESRERRMKFALSEMSRLADVLGLPESVLEESSRLYEKALDQEIVKGRRIESIAAALVYIVARNQGIPRTMSEIADESGITERELGKNYRYVARELDLRIVPVNPEDFISRFAEQLDLPGDVQAEARQIIRDAADENLLAGRSPDSIVAAALYLAARLAEEEVSQKDVANTVGVTEVTIRKGYHNLAEGLGLEEELEEKK